WIGGERSHVMVPVGDSLEIFLSCEAVGEGPGGGEYLYSLGEVTVSHPPGEWDGRVFQVTSSGGDGWFQAGYRMCSPSCEGAGIPAPLIHTQYRWLGHERLAWDWYGNPADLSGYWVYVDGARVAFTFNNSIGVDDYLPACGETHEINVTATQLTPTGIEESAFSNTWQLEGEPCPYTARVTFDTLEVHNPPADERGLHRPGPIYGELWVSSGDQVETLEFNACWCYLGPGASLWGTCDGLELSGSTYDIQRDIFGWIEREMASCLGIGCHSYVFFAPASNQLTINADVGEMVTVGARIMDCDERLNPPDTLFRETMSFLGVAESGETLSTTPYTLEGDHVNLDITIEVLSGSP
ncbi:MAG: hypothetical protein D6803_00820, partial [Anaerolineae bacterium]